MAVHPVIRQNRRTRKTGRDEPDCARRVAGLRGALRQVCASSVFAMVRNVIEARRWRLIFWSFHVSDCRFAMP